MQNPKTLRNVLPFLKTREICSLRAANLSLQNLEIVLDKPLGLEEVTRWVDASKVVLTEAYLDLGERCHLGEVMPRVGVKRSTRGSIRNRTPERQKKGGAIYVEVHRAERFGPSSSMEVGTDSDDMSLCDEDASSSSSDLDMPREVDAMESLVRKFPRRLSIATVQDLDGREQPLSSLASASSDSLDEININKIWVPPCLFHLRSLTLQGRNLNLTALRHCPQLKSLDLSATQVVHLDALSTCTNLTSLNICGTHVCDLWPLAGCTKLEVLNCGGARILDVGPLAHCQQLRSLDLGGTQVSAINALINCKNLTKIALDYSAISDISCLMVCTGLVEVHLSETPISSIDVFKYFPDLEVAELSSVYQLSDISSLQHCPRLRHLDLSRSQVSNVAVLRNCPELEILNLNFTKVSDLTPLQVCHKLKHVGLHFTEVRDILAIDCNSLESLDLSRCSHIADLNLQHSSLKQLNLARTSAVQSLENLSNCPLEELNIRDSNVSTLLPSPTLRKLVADQSALRDLSQLQCCKSLEELSLEATQVQDVGPLAHCTSLRTLNLRHTGVRDISSLPASLEEVCIAHCPVTDLTIFPNLRKLDCSYTRISSVAPLSHSAHLAELDLGNTAIAEIADIANITLIELKINWTQIRDISALSAMTTLQMLNVSNTAVSDVAAMKGIPELRRLFLNHTPVSNVSPLGACTDLRELHLTGTRVADISPLASCMQLQILHLVGTSVNNLSQAPPNCMIYME